ncbi:hypothetical protein BKA64DRAFT_349387 [Cadophora sp. MPI-SDFR-AT-0126]|nr:hypothetical protein BKA64DRAFT_349387 [Leotiomycetes sp. MPI-SDFR-AT-0126]
MATNESSDKPADNQCTLCGLFCGSRLDTCHMCHATYCGPPCLETDREVHLLVCRSIDRELPPDTRRGLRFSCDKSRPDFVWLEFDKNKSKIVAMLEPLVRTVRRTPLVPYTDFPWSQASTNDGKGTLHNPGTYNLSIFLLDIASRTSFCTWIEGHLNLHAKHVVSSKSAYV